MSGVRCQVSGVRCQVSGVRCQVSENTARRNGEHQQSAVLIACQGWFHEQVGGSAKIATDLAVYLAEQGWRVCYVCGTEDRKPVAPTVEQGVELWRYPRPCAPSPHPANALGNVMGTYRQVRRILRQTPLVCVNGHTPLQFLGASLAAGRKAARQVYSVHSPFADEIECNRTSGRAGFRQRVVGRIARSIEGVNCRRAGVVHCLSRFTVASLARQYGQGVESKSVVAPGWVDLQRFRPCDDISATRAALGPPWRTEKPVFFTVRRLEARMGLEPLVEAVKMLVDRRLGFRLLIGGAGSLEQTLKRRIHESGLEETVYLLGRIPDDELPRCYAAADCFVLPTRALECFGLIVLEAYACGVPVIATPVGAIPELVAEHGIQWLTRDITAEAIAERMAAFLKGELAGDRHVLRSLAARWGSDRGLERLAGILV